MHKIIATIILILLTIGVTSAAKCNDSCVGSVTVGPQIGTLTYATGDSVTYLVTVTRGTSSGPFIADLSIKPGLSKKEGERDSFSQRKVSFSASDISQTSILTISTKDATHAGQSSFVVEAKNTGKDKQTGIGILTIGSTAPVPELSTSLLTIVGIIGLVGLVRFSKSR